MNKLGFVRLWLWGFYLLLIIFVSGILMSQVGLRGEGPFNQEFYLDDITFLVNIIISSDFYLEYEYNLPEEYSIEITDKKVILDGIPKKHVKGKINSEREGGKLILKGNENLSNY